ncbi:peptidoglycan-binding protein [Streptomyces polyrhachis]|uniref:Peptidoglycan-binding protein n=1 Tax=Streptomyces polyrhachis TaxID=1282885 RepID=A0ABW2GD88_9ACTN
MKRQTSVERHTLGKTVAALATALISLGAATGCSDQAGAAAKAAPSPVRTTAAASAPPTSASPSASPSASASPSTSAPPSATPSAKPSKKPPAKPPKILLRPGDKGGEVRELQARLRQISWFNAAVTGSYGSLTTSAVSGFQGKRGLPRTGTVDEVTWRRLLGMTREPTRAELYAKAPSTTRAGLEAPDPRCMTGRVMCISKRSNSLRWIVDGQVRLTTDVRFGSYATPTREGQFSVFQKNRYFTSTLYGSEMPYAMFFSGGQAVHYSSDFAARGYNGASHGCVNVRSVNAIASLFAAVRLGDKVVVYR